MSKGITLLRDALTIIPALNQLCSPGSVR